VGSKLALSAVAAVLLVGCGGSQPEASQPETTQSEPGATSTSAPSEPAGNVPEIAGTALDGKALDVTEYRGRPLFVNVWSSW